MARGNQRDLARERNRKKAAEAGKNKETGDVTKRMEGHADIMRQKQAAADARKAAEALSGTKK